MIEEASELIESLSLTTINMFPFLTIYQYVNTLIVITGIGQTNAVIGLTTIINHFDIEVIYNFASKFHSLPILRIEQLLNLSFVLILEIYLKRN